MQLVLQVAAGTGECSGCAAADAAGVPVPCCCWPCAGQGGARVGDDTRRQGRWVVKAGHSQRLGRTLQAGEQEWGRSMGRWKRSATQAVSVTANTSAS